MSGERLIPSVLQGERMGRDVWTVPLGMAKAIGKLVKVGPLPIKIALAAQYMLHHPSNFGQKWNIRLGVTPVIPNLIKDTFFN